MGSNTQPAVQHTPETRRELLSPRELAELEERVLGDLPPHVFGRERPARRSYIRSVTHPVRRPATAVAPRTRAREHRPAGTRRTSSSSSTSSTDPGDPAPVGPGWRWVSEADWRRFVEDVQGGITEREIALERDGGWSR